MRRTAREDQKKHRASDGGRADGRIYFFRTSEDEWHFRTGFLELFPKNNLGLLRRKYQESHGKRFVKATGGLFESDKKRNRCE